MRYFAGCDVGSTTGKAVVLDETGKILAYGILPSTTDPEITATESLKQALAKMDIVYMIDGVPDIKDIARIVGTGYGRIELSFAHENISEITCHAIGAHYLDPGIRTVVDIGGQDCKAMSLREDGHVLDFVMNDKCAAGTGRFFEGIGRAFALSLDEFSSLSLSSKAPVTISSQCSVFAESEVISLISQRKSPADIAAGVQKAVAKRIMSLVRRVGIVEKLTITGGCAKNIGLVTALEEGLGLKLATLTMDAQMVGALGAAVLAMRSN